MDFAAFTQSHVSTADKLEPMKNAKTPIVCIVFYCLLMIDRYWLFQVSSIWYVQLVFNIVLFLSFGTIITK